MRRSLARVLGTALLLPALLKAQAPVSKPAVRATTAKTAARGPAQPVRFVLAASGNEARYVVREELVGVDFPYDVVGKTTAITGSVAFDGHGKLVPANSHVSVDVTTLKSDRANRDRYLKTAGIETDRYPRVELAITALRGFPATLPTTGQFSFELIGNLTVRTVTRPLTWQVTATANHGEFSGTARTAFKFGDFGMPVPTAFMVIKLEDNLRLEYDFHFVRDTTTSP